MTGNSGLRGGVTGGRELPCRPSQLKVACEGRGLLGLQACLASGGSDLATTALIAQEQNRAD